MGKFDSKPKKNCREPKLERKQTCYSALGVAPATSQERLHRCYLVLAETFHPDKQPRSRREEHEKYCKLEFHAHCPVCVATNKFTQITFAYATLKDPKRRALYDKQLKAAGTQCEKCHGDGVVSNGGFKSRKESICKFCEGTGQKLL